MLGMRDSLRFKPALTNRELDILRLMGQGLTTKEIAQVTLRSVKTIESHRDNLRRKLNLRTGAELLRYAALWQL